jgi:beta-1,4-mannosyltransferase
MMARGVQVREYRRWSLHVPDCDVLHVHWPESVFWGRVAGMGGLAKELCARMTLAKIDRVRRRNGILAWTAHNLAPHAAMDGAGAMTWRRYFSAFLDRVDLVISLTRTAEQALLKTYPQLQACHHAVVPHPHYRTAYPPPMARPVARAALGLPAGGTVIYSIGYMRPSKGLDTLITAFRACARDEEMLVIAGGADPDYADRLRHLAGDDGRVRIMARHLDDQQVTALVSAADGFVLNHQTVLNSGSLLLALSFDRPVLARLQGSLTEFAGMVGPDWVTPLDGPIEPAPLRAFLDSLQRRPDQGRAPLAALDPDAISMATLEQYSRALASRRTGNAAAR